MSTITSRDMQRQVREALQDHAHEFDVEGAVAELIAWYGRVDVGTIPSGPFWSTIYAHSRDPRGAIHAVNEWLTEGTS